MSSQILFEDMLQAYLTSEVGPAEYVASVGVDGFNMEEVVEAYAKFMRETEDDRVVRVNLEECTAIGLEDGKASDTLDLVEVNYEENWATFNLIH